MKNVQVKIIGHAWEEEVDGVRFYRLSIQDKFLPHIKAGDMAKKMRLYKNPNSLAAFDILAHVSKLAEEEA